MGAPERIQPGGQSKKQRSSRTRVRKEFGRDQKPSLRLELVVKSESMSNEESYDMVCIVPQGRSTLVQDIRRVGKRN